MEKKGWGKGKRKKMVEKRFEKGVCNFGGRERLN